MNMREYKFILIYLRAAGPGLRGPAVFLCTPVLPFFFIRNNSAFNALTWLVSLDLPPLPPPIPPLTALVTFLHRFAKSNEFVVSEQLNDAGLQHTNMSVFAFPPIESLISIVSGWFLYGMCLLPLVRALMTSPKAERLLFML